jgi:hypothetical protein
MSHILKSNLNADGVLIDVTKEMQRLGQENPPGSRKENKSLKLKRTKKVQSLGPVLQVQDDVYGVVRTPFQDGLSDIAKFCFSRVTSRRPDSANKPGHFRLT